MATPFALKEKPNGTPAKAAAKDATPPKVSRGKKMDAQRIVLYGPGGCGKTELCSLLTDQGIRPLFIDIEDGSNFLDVERNQPENYDQLLATLDNSELLAPYGAIIIDSMTKGEEMATAWTIANVPHDDKPNAKIESIEDYGYGRGLGHVYETMMKLLNRLDAVRRTGKHVIGICHDCTAPVPNPNGEDWIRYEPRLQSPASGKNSVRLRVREWCDHLLFIGYDVYSDSDGKAKGSGSRSIYTSERPTHMAKSRLTSETIQYTQGDGTIWNILLKGEK